MSAPVTKFLALSLREKSLFIEAWIVLAISVASLRLRPKRVLRGSLDWAGSAERSGTATEVATAITRAAAHHFVRSTCLIRSVALLRMLRRRDIRSRIVIGARRIDRELLSHAWVESGDAALNEAPGVDDRFPVLHVTADAVAEWNFPRD